MLSITIATSAQHARARLRAWFPSRECRFKSCLRHLSGQRLGETRVVALFRSGGNVPPNCHEQGLSRARSSVRGKGTIDGWHFHNSRFLLHRDNGLLKETFFASKEKARRLTIQKRSD